MKIRHKIHHTGLVALAMSAALIALIGGIVMVTPHDFSTPPALAFFSTTLYPTSDASRNQWFSSSGTQGAPMVNEVGNCDGNATYTYTTSTQLNWDEYFIDLSSIPQGSIVNALTISPCVGINSLSGTSTVQFSYNLFNPATSTVSGSFPSFSVTSTVPYNKASQTASMNFVSTSFSKLKIKVRSIGLPNAGIRLSQLGVQLQYSTKSALLFPVSDGSYLSWKISNYSGVLDEPVCDTTNYVYTTVASSSYTGYSQSVLFDLSSIPDNTVIKKITIQPCASLYSTSAQPSGTLRVALDLTGAATSTVNYSLSSTTTPQPLSPATFPYSVVKQANTQLHAIFTLTQGNNGVKVSNMSVQVEYE